MDEPTAQMCNNRTPVITDDGREGFATWHTTAFEPPMPAVVAEHPSGHCNNIWVWDDPAPRPKQSVHKCPPIQYMGRG